MSRSLFGWDLPPGVTSKMIDEAGGVEGPCEICGLDEWKCKCPECAVCGEIGRLACIQEHGLPVEPISDYGPGNPDYEHDGRGEDR